MFLAVDARYEVMYSSRVARRRRRIFCAKVVTATPSEGFLAIISSSN